MDTTCGISTVCVLPDFEICPTLDLRIDYMHPAEPHKDVYGFAECYRVTLNVIFTQRAFASLLGRSGQPIAHVVGAFMRMGSARLRRGQARLAAQGGGMSPTSLEQLVRDARRNNDYSPLVELIPYAKLLGIECLRLGDDMVFRLPANKDNIGNPTPAGHPWRRDAGFTGSMRRCCTR